MKSYETFVSATKSQRAESLKTSVASGVASKDLIGTEKKVAAKVLAAMIDCGDCEAGEINKTSQEICGREIRTVFQGVYELRVVFSAIAAEKIDLTEKEFDTLDGSKLALLSPFILKDDLKPKLGEAVAKLKDGGTAKELREIKGGEPKEPKKVKEMREKAEAAEKRAEEAETRAKEIESRYTVECQFAVTDLSDGGPLMKSQQLRTRLATDLKRSAASNDQEGLALMHDKFGRLFFSTCQALDCDPRAFIEHLAAAAAEYAKGAEAPAAAQTLEVATAAA